MRALIVLFVVGSAAVVRAQPADKPLILEIDRCPHSDANDDTLRREGAEHYARGETLYLQGDYDNAVSELVASYCKIPSFGYSILKDIGQAYERNLEYEKAVAYLERYVSSIPEDAKPTTQCAADPKEDAENVKRRISVLKKLKAHVLIQTQPGNAAITIERRSDGKLVERGTSGDTFPLVAGEYTIRVALRGHKEETRPLTTKIGQPANYNIELTPQTGKISVQVTPGDARIFLDDGRVDRFVGVGSYFALLDAKKYHVRAEKSGRQDDGRDIEIKPDQLTQVPLELPPTPQFGRRQLIVFSTVATSIAAGNLLNAFNQSVITSAGSIGGGAAALVFSVFYLPEKVPLGTSNLTITATLAGAVVGAAGSLLFTSNDNVFLPVTGAAMITAGVTGYYVGERTKIRPGDAALINSAMSWGAVSGALFAESFGPDRKVYAGLVLSGFGMGVLSGSVMTRYFDISRTHAVLIDVGGVIGILGGLAAESLIYGASKGGTDASARFTEAEREHLANFSLGGMAVGLISAGILTRNLDAPKSLPIQPTIGNVTTANGKSTTTFGIGASW